MADLGVFQMVLVGYLVLAFAKTLLCCASIDVAMGVLNRRLGRRHQIFRVLGILLIVPVAVTLMLPKFLFEEKLRFFVMYSKTKVMRDLINGF